MRPMVPLLLLLLQQLPRRSLSFRLPSGGGGGSQIYTPCDYPVPNEDGFGRRCRISYLHINYICDVHSVLSKTVADRVNHLVQGTEVYAKQRVRIGVAVLRVLHLPDELLLMSDGDDATPSAVVVDQRRDNNGAIALKEAAGGDDDDDNNNNNDEQQRRRREREQNGQCLRGVRESLAAQQPQSPQQSPTDMQQQNQSQLAERYLRTFADVLRRRWFGDECGPDLFFLAVTDSVLDRRHRRVHPVPHVQLSYGHELERMLQPEFCQSLQRELLQLLTDGGWRPAVVFLTVLERVAERLRTFTSIIVVHRSNQHAVPAWAIFTFVGCLGSVGLALSLEWSIVRRKALSLRGGGNGGGVGGGERHRISKGDNVQVHLYF